jgi:hypothetical protein
MTNDEVQQLTEEGVRRELQSQPHLLLRLAENALGVAESLRDNYFKNTAKLVAAVRRSMSAASEGKRDPILSYETLDRARWQDHQDEVCTFIDGGVGSVEISRQVPILLRVGSYSVRTGETRLREREAFGYYPVILGDLEGGSKDRKDFIDVVRITAELLGGLSALFRTHDARVLFFHGPLVYLVGSYAGHSPFTERDIDLLLGHYGATPEIGRDLKEKFLNEAYVTIYPQISQNYANWVKQRVFEPLSFMAFLYRQLMVIAKSRSPIPVIAGVVERGALREFSEKILLERIFRGLRQKGNGNYFNEMFGRDDLNSPAVLIDRLGYNDTLLLGMALKPGQMSESWTVDKYSGLRHGDVILPGSAVKERVDFSPLQKPEIGFPTVRAAYVHVSPITEPVRVEVFDAGLGDDQIIEASRRAYLYSRLLPGYGFPVGLDIVDKVAKVPAWMTDAYGKLIRWQLGVSLQQGEISDAQMRELLVQAIYITHRDWFFRPAAR